MFIINEGTVSPAYLSALSEFGRVVPYPPNTLIYAGVDSSFFIMMGKRSLDQYVKTEIPAVRFYSDVEFSPVFFSDKDVGFFFTCTESMTRDMYVKLSASILKAVKEFDPKINVFSKTTVLFIEKEGEIHPFGAGMFQHHLPFTTISMQVMFEINKSFNHVLKPAPIACVLNENGGQMGQGIGLQELIPSLNKEAFIDSVINNFTTFLHEYPQKWVLGPVDRQRIMDLAEKLEHPSWIHDAKYYK